VNCCAAGEHVSLCGIRSVVLKIIASLIRQSRQDDVTMEVKKLFLTDLSNFCVNSRENRR